jgi:lipoteichoic acid synthase
MKCNKERRLFMFQTLKRIVLLYLIIVSTIVYFEALFKYQIFVFDLSQNLALILLFSLAYAGFFLFFISFYRPRSMKKWMIVAVTLLTFMYLNQAIYYEVVSNFYSVQMVGDFSLGLTFIGDAFLALNVSHLLYLVPLVVILFINARFKELYDGNHFVLKLPLLILIMSAFFLVLGRESIDDTRETSLTEFAFSDKDLYDYVYNSALTIKSFGVLTYTQRDMLNAFRTPPLFVSEYEVLIDSYVSNQPNHLTNEMTASLEGKNFIMIMAESFDTFAIHPELTPTLFDLYTNHISFEHYYSPLYYRSTADTEFMTHTSFYPNKNVTLSMEAYMDNTFPNTLPKLFEARGYETYSYHNYIDYFYPRHAFHEDTLGFNVFKNASDLGLLNEASEGEVIFDHIWQRDLDLMALTIDDYIDQSPFFVNYITVSQHFQYSEQHEVAALHLDQVDAYLEATQSVMPDSIRYYMATAIELDLAVSYLMEQLRLKGILDNTVIMIYGDHYAYGISNETIWEYDTIKEDHHLQDIHRVPMLMFAPNTKLSGRFKDYFSSIDILPTLSNLFNLPAKYQYAFGRDVFSSHDHIVQFSDLSFISNDFSYDALTETYRIQNDAYTKDLLNTMHQLFISDYRYNVMILEQDYYKNKTLP